MSYGCIRRNHKVTHFYHSCGIKERIRSRIKLGTKHIHVHLFWKASELRMIDSFDQTEKTHTWNL